MDNTTVVTLVVTKMNSNMEIQVVFLQKHSSDVGLVTGDWPGSSLGICEMSHSLPVHAQGPVLTPHTVLHLCLDLAVVSAGGKVYPVNVICVHSN